MEQQIPGKLYIHKKKKEVLWPIAHHAGADPGEGVNLE